MALIKCNECGNHISDKAQHCVHCGVSSETAIGVVENSMRGKSFEKSSYKFSVTSQEDFVKNTPTTISIFKYVTFLIASLHITLAFLSPPMYPLELLFILYTNGIFISQLFLSALIAITIVMISLQTVRTRNAALRIVNGILYLVLCAGSFQVFIELNTYGLVWQWSLAAPRIPQAPVALLVSALQLCCVILLFLPQSAKYFSTNSEE